MMMMIMMTMMISDVYEQYRSGEFIGEADRESAGRMVVLKRELRKLFNRVAMATASM